MLWWVFIGVAVLAGITGYVLWGLQAPPSIQLVPRVDMWAYLRSVLRGEGFDERVDRLVKPLLRAHGVARVWLGEWFVVLDDPDVLRRVLGEPNSFHKLKPLPTTESLATRFMGSNLAETDGEDWRRHRRAAGPAFHRGWSTEVFGECTLELMARIRGDALTRIGPLLKNATLDALGRAVFGFDFKARDGGEYSKLYEDILIAVGDPLYAMIPFLETLPIPSRRRSRNQVDRFRGLLENLIHQRREEGCESTACDLVTLMVKASDEEDGFLSDEEIVNDAVLFFFVGHDTTANTLAFSLYYLSKHQDVQAKVRAEINAASPDSGIPSADQQATLTYLTAVIYETIRMAPVAFLLARTTACVIDDLLPFPLDKGQAILTHLGLCLRRPDVWTDPDTFNPSRFLSPDHLQLDRNAIKQMMGFGVGPRMCIGQQFALVEQRVLLSMLVQRYHIHLPKDSIHQAKPIMSCTGVPSIKDLDLIFSPIPLPVTPDPYNTLGS
ncbi:hypothetical protein DSO57_1019581 [Entomophthora muscae]|uniref:Uncharacterized protein n=1 Tax=Entomophthora muscae TaxID=34485 RepID=A0ACC2TRZ6_9FUNG|nr:hypothetical protein DSO57_1019581 [Entomophthora muscae]